MYIVLFMTIIMDCTYLSTYYSIQVVTGDVFHQSKVLVLLLVCLFHMICVFAIIFTLI